MNNKMTLEEEAAKSSIRHEISEVRALFISGMISEQTYAKLTAPLYDALLSYVRKLFCGT